MVRLLDLPPELIHAIYDWLRLIEHASPELLGVPRRTWQPTSRALRPYTQAYYFADVHVRRRRQLEQFASAVARSPALGAAVQSLEVRISPRREPDEDKPAVGFEDTLVEMWHSLKLVRSVAIRTLKFGLDELLVAVGQGLALARLEAVSLCVECDGWANLYDLEKWRTLVQAAPNLRYLYLTFDYPEGGLDGLDSAAGTAVPVFRSAVTAMEVYAFPFPHEAALASLINALPDLESLALSPETQTVRLGTVPLLRLANLRELKYRWLDTDEAVTSIASFDVRHLAALEHVTFSSGPCMPAFYFAFPPATTRLTIEVDNEVPLAALTSLITPGTRHFHPNLRQIKLHLPFSQDFKDELEHLTFEEMVAYEMDTSCEMHWTEAVSRAGLEELIRVAQVRGVELTGNCRAAFRVEEVAKSVKRMEASREGIFDAISDGEDGGSR